MDAPGGHPNSDTSSAISPPSNATSGKDTQNSPAGSATNVSSASPEPMVVCDTVSFDPFFLCVCVFTVFVVFVCWWG